MSYADLSFYELFQLHGVSLFTMIIFLYLLIYFESSFTKHYIKSYYFILYFYWNIFYISYYE